MLLESRLDTSRGKGDTKESGNAKVFFKDAGELLIEKNAFKRKSNPNLFW